MSAGTLREQESSIKKVVAFTPVQCIYWNIFSCFREGEDCCRKIDS